ncbi:MAG TPA: hypothetical protein ENK65_03350 [Helicobacteraceae bacterium]|nr:hypothetical protein [Helicobacteraceae bacterium]
MQEFFANYSNYILFFHVLSAIIWVGGMIALRFAVHPAMQHIEDPTIKLARTLEFLKRFFMMVIPFIVLLIITAALLAIGLNFKEGDPFLYQVVHVKEGLWTIMTIIFSVIFVRRNRAEKAFIAGDFTETKRQLAPIAAYLIPTNIALGVIALYFGGILRGF